MASVPTATPQTRNVEAIYPLSPLQDGLLFHTLAQPNSGAYFIQSVFRLEGNVNSCALRRAWEMVVERHGSLRTLFLWARRDRPLQVVRGEVSLPWSEFDWHSISLQQQESQIETLMEEQRASGFQLDRAPLMRFQLIRTREQEWLLVWNFHHLLLDGWSYALVQKEVFETYAALTRGEQPRLSPTRPYRDYIQWLQKQDMDAAETFWRTSLAGFTAPTSLGVDKVGRSQGGSARLRLRREMEPAVLSGLREMGRRCGLTLNTIIQGAWATVLGRYSGEDDVVFGVTSSGRPADLEGAEQIVGMFINTLPLRARLSSTISAANWLQQLQAQQAEARQFEYTPLSAIQKWSSLPRGTELFASLVGFENYPLGPVQGFHTDELRVTNIKFREQTNLPLALQVLPGEELILLLDGDATRFDAPALERMIGHVQTVLEEIAAHPGKSLPEMPLLTAKERQQILVEWNRTQTEYPRDKCAHELFEDQVRIQPTHMAVISRNGQLTYDELNQRANQVAHFLMTKGIGPGSLVGVCVGRSLEMVVGFLAVLKAGAAYLPLDPAYPGSRNKAILEDAGVRMLLTRRDFIKEFSGSNLIQVCLDDSTEACWEESASTPRLALKSTDVAYAIFTSGSTGQPKGTLISHESLVNLIFWHRRAFQVSCDDQASVVAGPAFDASIWEIWPYLAAGACLQIVEPELLGNPEKLRDWLIAKRITIVFLPTVIAEQIAGLHWPTSGSLRLLLAGGDRLHAVMNEALPFELINNYGPTENTVVATYGKVRCGDQTMPSIGRPIDNVTAYVLDAHLNPMPVGVAGELAIGGESLAIGYLNRPELTAEKFVPNPFSERPASRLYKTGDIVRYRPSGEIEFVGRRDDQVKIRGYRIELGEIEATLKRVGALKDCVVILAEDNRGIERLNAYCVLGKSPISAEDLRRELERLLPEYMVPSAFVFLETIPLTPNGKVDRRALPVPLKLSSSCHRDAASAAQTTLEEVLWKIWAEILHVEGFGLQDNFFELGGTSLDHFALMNRIEREFGRTLSLTEIRKATTIEKLARVLQDDPESIAEGPTTTKTRGTLLQRWKQNPKQALIDLRESLYEQIVQNGPSRTPGILPYGAGNRVLMRIARSKSVRILFRTSLPLLREHLPAACEDFETICQTSVLSNVWFVWRAAAVATGKDVDRWISVKGWNHVEDANQGRGLVLVTSHAHMRRFVPWILKRRGLTEWGAVGIGGDDGTMRALSLQNALQGSLASGDEPEFAYFSSQLQQAKHFLERGGVVQMAPDGHFGKDIGLTFPFFDRCLTLRTGFAHLAVSTGASVVAAMAWIDSSGKITVEFLPELRPVGATHQERVKSLVSQFAAAYQREWQEHFDNVNWAYLKRYHDGLFPFRATRRTETRAARISELSVSA